MLNDTSRQPTDFPEPLTVNPRRPVQVYQVMQDASYSKCLGTVEAEEVRCF